MATVTATTAPLSLVAVPSLWLVIPAWTPESSRPRTAIVYGCRHYRRLPSATALNSGGFAEWFVLDSRVRGNDDLGMVASEGVGRVIGARRTVDDGTDMSVPYGDRAVADTVAAVKRRA